MRRRTDGEQVNHHELAIVFPARAQETALRLPSHAERFAAVEHPRPIHALVDCSCKILDLGIIEMLANRQHAAEQKRGVDRGEFTIPYSLSGFDNDEVVEEAVLVGQSPREKAKRLPHPIPDRRRLPVTARFPDAQAAESKARRRNTGNAPLVVAIKQRAIPDLAGRAAGFVPKKLERGALDFVLQLIIGTAIRISLRLVKRPPPRRHASEARLGKLNSPKAAEVSISRVV